MSRANILAAGKVENNQSSRLMQLLKDIIPYFGFLFLFIVFALTTKGRFIKPSNITLILKQASIVMIGTMGTTFVMAHGNLDFSIGGELALCALAGWYASQLSPFLMLPICILTGIVLSWLISKIHVKLGVPVFTAGLCIMFIGKGIAQSLGATTVMTSSTVFNRFDTVNFYLIVSAVVVVISYVLFENTRLGKFNKAIGVNPKTAQYSGIPVNKYKVLAFVITGAAVGLSAFLSIIRAGGVTAQTGATFEIDVLLVMVLGGIPLSGGSGVKIRNGVIGAITFFMLNNGLTLWGVSAEIIYVIKGLLFLVIVSLSYDRNTGKEIF